MGRKSLISQQTLIVTQARRHTRTYCISVGPNTQKRRHDLENVMDAHSFAQWPLRLPSWKSSALPSLSSSPDDYMLIHNNQLQHCDHWRVNNNDHLVTILWSAGETLGPGNHVTLHYYIQTNAPHPPCKRMCPLRPQLPFRNGSINITKSPRLNKPKLAPTLLISRPNRAVGRSADHRGSAANSAKQQ